MELIISGNTSYTHLFVFISPLDNFNVNYKKEYMLYFILCKTVENVFIWL